MSIAASVALAGIVFAGDRVSTSGAYTRLQAANSNAVVIEQSAAGPFAGPLIFGLAVGGGDLLIQKGAPKLKWPYRIAVIGALGYVVAHNSRVGR